jgi:hypothetical protein
MKRACCIFVAVLVSSCATTNQAQKPVPEKRIIVNSLTLPTNIDGVWQKLINYFSEKSIPIETMDSKGYFIKTSPADIVGIFTDTKFKMTKENDWCNCEASKVWNAWAIKYIIKFSYNVSLKQVGNDSTGITATVFYSGKQLWREKGLLASGYDHEVEMVCKTAGLAESNLFDYLKNGL